MIRSPFQQWHFTAFPDTVLVSSDTAESFPVVFLLFIALSAGYLFFSYILARFFPARRQQLSVSLSIIYTICIMLMSFELSTWAKTIPFMPLLLVISFVLLNAGFIISLCGSWFTNNRETDVPLSLFENIRANYWFTLLSNWLLFFIIFIQIPIITPENHTVYWVPIILALLFFYLPTWTLTNYSSKILGIHLEPDTLTDTLKLNYKKLDQFIQKQGNYQLVLLNKGFRNAVALYPHEKILFGIDLLEYLPEKEIQAIALHEIGHLQDKKYIPLRHRISQFLPFLILAFVVADQGKMFPSFLFQITVFIASIILFSILFKRIRLKAEFVADTFVKDFQGEFHPHLISGIKKITRLNGLSKDLCKTNDLGHLDIDEREQMVKEGTFALRRKPIRKFFLILIPAMALGILFQFGWSALFPSKSEQWRTLHDLYHDQVSHYDFTLAAETIQKTLDFSLKNFGEIDRRTYISLKHLATTALRQKDISAAEQHMTQAGRVGEELYGRESLRRRDEWKLLARIYVKQDRKEEAKQIHVTLLSLQQKLQDTPRNISNTLYDLAELSDDKQTINYFQKIIQLYKETPPTAKNDSPSEYIFSELAKAYIQTGQPEKAKALLADAATVIQEKRGSESKEYCNILWEFANLLSNQKQYNKAETLYQQCIEASLEMESDISIACRYGLGENFRQQGLLEQAEQQTHLALTMEEELYGKDSEEILFGLDKLAQIAEESGNLVKEETLRQRVKAIDEKAH